MVIHAMWSRTNGPVRRFLLLCAITVTVVALGSCGDSDSDSDSDAGGTDATTEVTETSDTTAVDTSSTSADTETTASTETATAAGAEADVEQLVEAIDATIDRQSAGFSLEVVQTLPVVGSNQASMRRTGSFDDQQQIGIGTQRFLGESVESAELPGYAGEALEHRIVDGTYWLLNPVSDPPSWIGYGLDDFTQLTGSDPALAVDGDLYLRTIRDAIVSVTDMAEFGDGSEGWALLVDADELLPLVVTAGVQQRLVADGLGPTDVEATVSVAVDPDGMVVGLIAELNEWWQAVLAQTTEPGNAPAGMVVQFQIGDFDAPVEVDTPCADPEEIDEPDGPPALVCEG